MGFLDIGILEIVLILIVALIIWGPGRIPEVGRTLGKIVRAFKKASFDLTSELTKEIGREEKDRPHHQSANSSDETTESATVSKARPPHRGDNG